MRRDEKKPGWYNWPGVKYVCALVDGCSGGLSLLVRLTLRRPPKFEPA